MDRHRRLTKSIVQDEAHKLGYGLRGPAGDYTIVEWQSSGSYRVVMWPYSGTLAEAMAYLRGVADGKGIR